MNHSAGPPPFTPHNDRAPDGRDERRTLAERLLAFPWDDWGTEEAQRVWPELVAVVEKAAPAQQNALAIMRREGFVFTTPLGKPDEERTEAERWEKLAFTLYTTLCEIDTKTQALERRLDEAEE